MHSLNFQQTKQMNWDDLKYFLALSREGSVSGAGRALGVKHTTVARRITGFETRLGTRLFDRTPDGYAMTQAAENMFEHALAIEALAQTIDREVAGQDAELAGSLKLTVAHDFVDRLLMSRLGQFQKRFPLIDLQLITTTGLVDLAAREADIAVRLTASPPDFLVGREVMKLIHGVYGTTRTLKNLSGRIDVALYRSDPEYPPWVTENFAKARTAVRVDDVSSMCVAVRNHMGLARIPCYIGDSDPRLRRLDVPLTPSDWGIWVLSHVDLRATARVRVCREFLIESLEQQRSFIQGEQSKFI